MLRTETMKIAKAVLCFAVMCMSAGPMLAQSSTQGAIGGTVEDPTGAVVAKATVMIHNDATNAEIVLTADESGYFKAPLLEPGNYTVTVTSPGFSGYKTDVTGGRWVS